MISKKRYSRPIAWSQKSPTHGEQRDLMKKKCGKKCFLRPKDNGFPICTSNCVFDCSGLNAAKNRARQYNYTSIENKANRTLLSIGCKSAKKSSARKSAPRKSPKRKPCKSNQVRNRSTGRCRKKSTMSSRKSRVKPNRKISCKSNQVRNRSTGRCRKKSTKLSRKSPTRKSRVKVSRKRSSQRMKPYERAIEFNLKYYSKHDAGKINTTVRSYLKKANQTYKLTVDLLDVASGIAWREYSKKIVTMRDIKLAKSVDSLLEKKFP